MKVDTLAHVKNHLSAVIEGLGQEPLFITRNGRVAAVLQAVTDEDTEDYLLRNSPRFWRLIESRRAQAAAGQAIPFDPAAYGRKAVGASAVREMPESYGTAPCTGPARSRRSRGRRK
jgi:PHD/YefM family antitoxin component YafN of YafNO toxin-antitoxin module